MKIGYTKAYRKELDSDVWKMPPLYQRVFFYLRQEAVWQPETFPTRKGYGIALNPGQLITSFSTIADGVSWYEYGVKKIPNRKTIKDILGWLESNAMVTVFSNRHGTFIMLINWGTYNCVENEKVTPNKQPKVTPEKQSADTLKEGKESLRSKEITNILNNHSTSFPKNKNEGQDQPKDFYLTKKNKELSGKRLETFLQFWDAFDYKSGKAGAADVWLTIPKLTDAIVSEIIIAAQKEAQNRPVTRANGNTPKMGQGWLSDRRWEDECNNLGPNTGCRRTDANMRAGMAFLEDDKDE